MWEHLITDGCWQGPAEPLHTAGGSLAPRGKSQAWGQGPVPVEEATWHIHDVEPGPQQSVVPWSGSPLPIPVASRLLLHQAKAQTKFPPGCLQWQREGLQLPMSPMRGDPRKLPPLFTQP